MKIAVPTKPSGDFASSAMMRLVALGLSRQGVVAPHSPPSQAHIPRAQKRDLLDKVLSEHGPLAIFKICDAAWHLPREPVLQALIRARSIGDLLDRWRRLERFSHGRHTVEFAPLANGSFTLTHCARDEGPPPTRAESYLVFGLLAVLSEIIGSENVTLCSKAGESWRFDGKWRTPSHGVVPMSAVLTARDKKSTERVGDASPADNFVADVRRRLTTDPARRWSLAALAEETGMSTRTLQRRLFGEDLSFSHILSQARLEVAAEHLCKPDGPSLAEIGFLAGYSDQAHFTRSFSRAVGTTPSAYRTDFQG